MKTKKNIKYCQLYVVTSIDLKTNFKFIKTNHLKGQLIMENLTNEQKHEEALKQKEIDSQQLLEYIQFNTMSKSSLLEEELLTVLKENEFTDTAKKAIARCVQIARGYTEYKVLTIE